MCSADDDRTDVNHAPGEINRQNVHACRDLFATPLPATRSSVHVHNQQQPEARNCLQSLEEAAENRSNSNVHREPNPALLVQMEQKSKQYAYGAWSARSTLA